MDSDKVDMKMPQEPAPVMLQKPHLTDEQPVSVPDSDLSRRHVVPNGAKHRYVAILRNLLLMTLVMVLDPGAADDDDTARR